MRSIAADYGLNRKTITPVLRPEGIPIPACCPQVQFVIDPDWLRAQYLEHRRTLPDIARQVGDTAIVGISPDAPSKQKKFDAKYGLGFPLLSDPAHTVAEAYDVWKEKSMYGRKYMGIERSAFLIDEKGKIEQAWYKVSPKDTPTNLLKALEA